MKKVGDLIGITKDTRTNTVYCYTKSRVIRIDNSKETRDVWRLFLEQGQFSEALRFCHSDEERNMVSGNCLPCVCTSFTRSLLDFTLLFHLPPLRSCWHKPTPSLWRATTTPLPWPLPRPRPALRMCRSNSSAKVRCRLFRSWASVILSAFVPLSLFFPCLST